jgi:hypothetical protein
MGDPSVNVISANIRQILYEGVNGIAIYMADR